MISATLRKPKVATRWSARRFAREGGLSSASVQRISQKCNRTGWKPSRSAATRSSTPNWPTSVGLYLDAPERALVLCVDEKSQIQALNRTQPALRMWPGLPARMTHDYIRHGHHQPVCRSGSGQRKVHGRCFKRHTHLESIAFLESLVRRLTKTGVAPDLRQLPEPIRILRSDSGSPLTRASTFISPRPAPLGSTWWNAGSHRLPVRFTTTTGPVDLKTVGILVPRNGTPSARK